MNLDLTSLTITQIALVLFALTALDWISGVGGALAHGTFKVSDVAAFVQTHVLQRVIPLVFCAAIGQGDFGLPQITPVWAIFLAGGAAYLAETIASIASNLGTSSAPSNAA